METMKRIFDLVLATVAGIFLLIPVLLVAISVRVTSRGPALYWSDRVGRNIPPAVATHLLSNPDAHLTPIGS